MRGDRNGRREERAGEGLRELCVVARLKPVIHSVCLTRNSRGGRLTIGWQAAAPAVQPIVNRPSRDFHLRKTIWMILAINAVLRHINAVDNDPNSCSCRKSRADSGTMRAIIRCVLAPLDGTNYRPVSTTASTSSWSSRRTTREHGTHTKRWLARCTLTADCVKHNIHTIIMTRKDVAGDWDFVTTKSRGGGLPLAGRSLRRPVSRWLKLIRQASSASEQRCG